MSDRLRKLSKSACTTKAFTIITLLQCNKGANIVELMKTTGWQTYGPRGLIAGPKPDCIAKGSREDSRPRRYFLQGDQS